MTTPDPMPTERLAEIRARAEAAAYPGRMQSYDETDRADLLAEVDRLRAELANARTTVLDEALGLVVDRQMADSNRFVAEGRTIQGSCGSYCNHGETCHGAEAYAALNRFGRDLLALKAREEVTAGRS